jgi:DNA-binding CsgD family transcriptional regulator
MVAPGVLGLMERELETAHLQRAIDHSFHGVGRLVVIEGPAGIGKTTLIANALEIGSLAPRRVAEGVLVRLGRQSPAAPQLAYAVAILGDGASLATAAALAGLDERTAIEAAATMRTGEVLIDAVADLLRQHQLDAVLAFERMNANRPKVEVLDLLTRAGLHPESHDDRVLLPPAVMTAAATLSYLDEFDRAEAICSSVIERSRRRGSPASLLIGLAMRAQIAYRRGALDEALTDANAAFRLATEVAAASTALQLHPLATINNVAVEQERSESELTQLLARTDESLHRDTLHGSLTLLSRARLLHALGRPEVALDQLLEFAQLPRAFATGAPAFVAWRSDAAQIMHQLGDRKGAQRLAGEELELAREMGASRAVGIALRTFGLVQPQPAVDVLTEAVRVLDGSPARLEHARALVDLGAALRRSGERAASRDPLRGGHAQAVLCGASKLAERARQELAASGARSSTAGLSGAASLTPSERRVAELAAQGQSNRDIAQTLFVTEKTVETHLGHAYDKLGVRSRHKLAAVLA